MLNIEIKGIGFHNKGAELMLNAIIDHFTSISPNVRFIVELPVSRRQLKQFNLHLKTRYLRRGHNIVRFLNFLPKFILHKLNIVKASEINMVIDASGYAYGDPFPPRAIRNKLALELESLKQAGTPIILMPQAFGPFKKDSVRSAFLPILEQADIIFARDEQSLNYLNDIAKVTTRVERAPDFTSLVTADEYPHFKPGPKSLCLIPNLKMLQHTKLAENYLDFFRALLCKAKKSGYEPFLLVHEEAEDKPVCDKLLENLKDYEFPVIIPATAKECKWVIGRSRLVVSSRYHGLISALSQATPVFATSWSHKYQALLNDYDSSDKLVDLSSVNTEVERVLEILKSDEALNTIRKHLQHNAETQRQETLKMWATIDSLLSSKFSV
ncbi:polysaccharide pyruvyl transferase family protein [Pseudidiomarina halophila]|uniref:Polysaccharide pyruvyl transferase domain-containing protein n=1 Tax=Pseudidiomarina halophila TaxID=1449799 RepID=A0A432XWN9_9GAMM|nr:polysaccharide pyruvyl transferase family protein [Pseudidiomarina halophila]RUO53165.1 hypothetical protein CWI69_09090 [Pseudidiomarina halophila]